MSAGSLTSASLLAFPFNDKKRPARIEIVIPLFASFPGHFGVARDLTASASVSRHPKSKLVRLKLVPSGSSTEPRSNLVFACLSRSGPIRLYIALIS